MSANNVEQRALSAISAFERAGRAVKRVVIEGRRFELELVHRDELDEFEGIDMRHGKT